MKPLNELIEGKNLTESNDLLEAALKHEEMTPLQVAVSNVINTEDVGRFLSNYITDVAEAMGLLEDPEGQRRENEEIFRFLRMQAQYRAIFADREDV